MEYIINNNSVIQLHPKYKNELEKYLKNTEINHLYITDYDTQFSTNINIFTCNSDIKCAFTNNIIKYKGELYKNSFHNFITPLEI